MLSARYITIENPAYISTKKITIGIVLAAERAEARLIWCASAAGARPLDQQHASLIAYGILLLGLLRKSFIWPSLWNIRGQERSHLGLASGEAQRLPISTQTLASLEGLLRPRSWETQLLFGFAPGFTGLNFEDVQQLDRDTELDVPSLSTVEDIRKAIGEAQRLLVNGQVAGLSLRPRQLIPVDIRYLLKSNLVPGDELRPASDAEEQ